MEKFEYFLDPSKTPIEISLAPILHRIENLKKKKNFGDIDMEIAPHRISNNIDSHHFPLQLNRDIALEVQTEKLTNLCDKTTNRCEI